MFDAVRNNKRIVQIFLGLITLPFAFWGVDSYVRNAGAGNDFASVGDTKITAQQFDLAMRERQDQMRQALGANFQPEMMNTPQAKLGLLNSLIDQRLILVEASKNRMFVDDNALRDVISKIPSLQEDGKFSMARYETALRSQGYSQPQFEAKLRQDLTMQQLIGAVGDTAFVSDAQAAAMLRLQLEERSFSEFKIAAEPFADKVKIDAAAVQKFYDENKPRFEVAEKVKVDYVVLSLDALLAQTTVDEAEVKKAYEANKDRYGQPEERRASHILILANSGGDKAKAKAKAEDVLKQVRAAPAKFAELAKQYSEDPGSAKNGGDLGYFSRGMMVKPFADAAFSEKEGEISNVVESEFGFHIIKLTGIHAAKVRSLDEVRGEIESEMKRQSAAKKFAESAEAFSNMVYEQADSLQPAADKFKLKVQHSDWIARNPDAKQLAALGPLANEKVLASLFSDDAIKNKRNSEAIEVAPNTLVAARIAEHVPASLKPLDSVKADVEALLKAREAAAMAQAAGESKLAELKGGSDTVAWSPAQVLSRMQNSPLPPAAAAAILKADVQKLPAYVGASVNGAYTIYKIVKVTQPEKIDEAQRKALQAEYARIVAQEDLAAYLADLRGRYKININTALLEAKER
jgi:peptidyl-prolyl cis-trans isomerase D